MKIFIALFTVVTLQLSLIRAREVEEQNVEDQLLEVEADLDDSDLKEDLHDSNTVELRARPSKRPFCIRTRRLGWGGQCLSPVALLNQSCDFIWSNDRPNGANEEVCRDSEKYCCIDCNAPKQNENCNLDATEVFARRTCCPGELNRKTMASGCLCCGKCKRTQFCRRKNGFCVTKNDAVLNYEYCKEIIGGRIKTRACEGKGCACCIPPDN